MIPSNDRLRVVHIITGLQTGGAEMMLYKLLKAHQQSFDCRVISLTGDGAVGKKIRDLGVPIELLGLSTRMPNPSKLFKLVRSLKKTQTQIVQTWMYHSDLAGGLAAFLAGNLPLVWGLHNSTIDVRMTKVRTQQIIRINALLSRWLPDRIVSCSEDACKLHVELGYPFEKMTVIPNGFDLSDFQPDPSAHSLLRKELDVPLNSQVIGHIARFDPQKDHHTLLEAAAILKQNMPKVHFALCGEGVTSSNTLLTGWIKQMGLEQTVHLLGRRDDIERITAGLDLSTLSSAYGEAFPNAVGEAMACGLPCVVTDVGDCKFLVAETGLVVPPRNPEALSQAWKALLTISEEMRWKLGLAARTRVQMNFSINEVAEKYAQVYESLRKGSRT